MTDPAASAPPFPDPTHGPFPRPRDVPPPYPEDHDAPPPYPVEEPPPAYPDAPAVPHPCPREEVPPPYPGEPGTPAPRPGEEPPPPYPGEAAVPPPYPGETRAAPAYPGTDGGAPEYPAVSGEPSPYPGEAVPPPLPPYAPDVESPLPPHPADPWNSPPTPGGSTADVSGHHDLEMDHGRRLVKARQRGMDGAALSQLLLTVPIGIISLGVVIGLCAFLPAPIGFLVPVVWLFSGPLVFDRRTEGIIARRLYGMRRPSPEEARRLDAVWEQVTRRAGVDRETYQLWIQERQALNSTAAAGHIVAVTRHAMDQLPDTRLAAVLAHELGHHVGGHTWAGMLAEWYALPARTAGRLVLLLLAVLFTRRHWAAVLCGGCLSLSIVWMLLALTFEQGMWWLTVPVALAPVCMAWLHRHAEFRADAYSVALGFGEALEDVLLRERQAIGSTLPPAPGSPAPTPAADPYAMDTPEALPTSGRIMPQGAHANVEARLRNVRLVREQRIQR